MALILSGDTGVPASGMPAGSVIQVVNATSNTQVLTSTGGAAISACTASITPTSSTSKVLIIAKMPWKLVRDISTGTAWGGIRLLRNGTAISPNPGDNYEFGLNWGSSGTSDMRGIAFVQSLDSPASASSVTYTLQGLLYASGNTLVANESGLYYSSITLQEIKQ